MLPKEIIELLKKYTNQNEQAIINIRKDIDDIIYNLGLVNECISSELQYLLSERDTDKTNELYQDCITLCGYINSIDPSQNKDLKGKSDNNIEEPTHSNINDMPKPIKLYLCEDNICPECNCSMLETHTTFTENNGYKTTIDTYICNCCNRFFVCDFTINDIDVENANLIIKRDYYNKIPPMDINSVIILRNTLKCFSHRTHDFIAQIPTLDKDGNIFYYKLDASYCFDCNRFTIFESDFHTIKNIVMCKVIDETYTGNQTKLGNQFDSEKDISALRYYGYNVQTQKNISKQQRHIILSSIIESGIMNRRQVIDHINTLIQRGSKIKSWDNATQKWKDDIEFVKTYKIEELPEVIFDKIILRVCQEKCVSLKKFFPGLSRKMCKFKKVFSYRQFIKLPVLYIRINTAHT